MRPGEIESVEALRPDVSTRHQHSQQRRQADASLPGGDPPVQQHRPGEGAAEQVQVDRREQQPQPRRAHQCPADAARPARQQRQECHREKHGDLRAHELVMNQRPPPHRGGEQERDLRLAEHQRGTFVGDHPGKDGQDAEGKRREELPDGVRDPGHQGASHPADPGKRPPEQHHEIPDADQSAEEVARVAQAAEALPQPVAQRLPLEVSEGGKHGLRVAGCEDERGSGYFGRSAVARKKISSRSGGTPPSVSAN